MVSTRKITIFFIALVLLPYTKIQVWVVEGRRYIISIQVTKEEVHEGGVDLLMAKINEKEEQKELKRKMKSKLGDMKMVKEKSLTPNAALFKQRIKRSNLNEKRKPFLETDYQNRHRQLLDVKASSFIVFNADYYGPKPHPPKNN